MSGLVTNLLWADGSSSGAGLLSQNGPGVWGNGVDDAMFNSYIYNYGVSITNIFTNVPSGIYDFYLYGHGPEDGNSVFQLTSGTNAYVGKGTTMWGTNWASTNWDESQQYVVYRNVSVESNQPVVITAIPGVSDYAIINGLQIYLPMDRDGNGLPDWWELEYFSHTGVDPDADPDGDGLSNLREYEAGTSPLTQDTDGDGIIDQPFGVRITEPTPSH